MTRYLNSGRFAYAMGYKSREAAQNAFNDMCAEGEMTPCEGKVESYTARKDGKPVTRYAVSVEG